MNLSALNDLRDAVYRTAISVLDAELLICNLRASFSNFCKKFKNLRPQIEIPLPIVTEILLSLSNTTYFINIGPGVTSEKPSFYGKALYVYSNGPRRSCGRAKAVTTTAVSRFSTFSLAAQNSMPSLASNAPNRSVALTSDFLKRLSFFLQIA